MMSRWLPAVLPCVLLMVGCAQTRTVTITTRPADALIRIDGIERGRGPITEQFVFRAPGDVRRVTASRLGFKDTTITVTSDFDRRELLIELKPQTRRISISVLPAPAIISVDGKPLSSEPLSAASPELEFTVDARNQWTTHTITAERTNFVKAQQVVSWGDRDPVYVLSLEPMRKDLAITTNPPGAEVFLDGERLGVSPLRDVGRAFPVDLDTNEFLPRRLVAAKAGYDPVEISISWDAGKTDYAIDLAVKTKRVRIISDPPGASVTIDGAEVPRDPSGMTIATLQFPPINEKGDLKAYRMTVRKKTADSEWEPQTLTLGWDNGRTDYPVTLKEILTRPVQMLQAAMRRSDEGWEVVPEWLTTIAMKDVTEGSKRPSPAQITRLPKGTQIGSLAISPDGSQILFTVLSGGDRGDFRSKMIVIRTDGSGTADIISDGRSLDIMPSYTPGGDQIIFCSNRAGRRLNVWGMSATGAPGITRLTSGDTNDLWPTMDSDPKPRLFYQAMVDTRPDPRLYMTQIGTIFQTDLTTLGGTQPRVSPKNDAIVFAAVNEKTGKRDIHRMSDRGGVSENLTNTPDVDEFDAAWSKDGSRVAFASDAGTDEEGRHNYDIWVMDVMAAKQPVQITTNGSHDDCPVWDTTGGAIYFRSNRGGEWGIWRISAR